MSATMVVGQRQICLKLQWLKHPKTVPRKRNLDQKINDSKPHFGVYQQLIFSFSDRKTQSQQKLVKKIIHFAIQFSSKKHHSFYNPQLIQFTPAIQPKNCKLCKCVFGCCQKTICVAPFLDPKNCIREALVEQIFLLIFLQISAIKFLFQRLKKLLCSVEA